MAAGAAKTSATMKRRIGDRCLANRTENTPNAAAAAMRPMKLAPIRPEPVVIGKTRDGKPEHQGECVSGECVGDDTEDTDQRYAHQHHGGDHDGFLKLGRLPFVRSCACPVTFSWLRTFTPRPRASCSPVGRSRSSGRAPLGARPEFFRASAEKPGPLARSRLAAHSAAAE